MIDEKIIENWEIKQERRIFIEECIYCGCETDVPKSLHIDYRDNYIEGVGQVCRKCYNKIFKDVGLGTTLKL